MTYSLHQGIRIKRGRLLLLRQPLLALAFTAVLLFILSGFTATGSWMVVSIAAGILMLSYIPWHVSKRIKLNVVSVKVLENQD